MSNWHLKNTALISRSNPRYVMHCREQAALKNAIPKERIADPRQVLTSWAEANINRLLARHFESDDRSILTWEELGAGSTYRPKYKELDGIFKNSDGHLYVETKATTSNSSIKKGKSQINENLQILSNINPRFSALLVLCDCHFLDSEFGVMSDEMRLNILSSDEYSIYEGLSEIPKIVPRTKSIWLIDTTAVIELIKLFGSPVDDSGGIDI
jgi:hypothetical protein